MTGSDFRAKILEACHWSAKLRSPSVLSCHHTVKYNRSLSRFAVTSAAFTFTVPGIGPMWTVNETGYKYLKTEVGRGGRARFRFFAEIRLNKMAKRAVGVLERKSGNLC
jgi:hypothetical protein